MKNRLTSLFALTALLVVLFLTATPYSLTFASDQELWAEDASSAPVLTINKVLQWNTTGLPRQRVRVQGVVTSKVPGKSIFIRDDTNGVLVLTAETGGVEIGHWMDVAGFPMMKDYAVVLRDPLLRRLDGPFNVAPLHQTREPAPPDPDLPTLGQIRQIRELKSDEARKAHPVRLRGVTTYYDRSAPNLFVQDATGGIYVYTAGQQFELQAGQVIEIEGITGPGDFAPSISRPRIKVLGRGAIPAASRVTYDELVSGRQDSQFVEIEGLVRSVVEQDRRILLEVNSGGGRFRAYVPASSDPQLHLELVDARVRLRGVCGALFNQRRQLMGAHLFVPSLGSITVLKKPSYTDPFSLPVSSIENLLRFSPHEEVDRRVRLQGRVTLQVGRTLFVQDNSEAIRVQTVQPVPVQRGDLVDAVGFPAMSEFSAILQDAIIRRLRPGQLPFAVEVTADQALGGHYNNKLICTEARLLDRAFNSTENVLVLESGPFVFNAHLEPKQRGDHFSFLQKDSVVELTGVCSVQADETQGPRSFRLLLDSTADVVVLKQPPWWTPRRMLSLLAISGAGGLAVLAWVGVLRRRVRSQTELVAARAQELAKQRSFLRQVIDLSPSLIFAKDREGRFTLANRSLADLYGTSVEALLNKTEAEFTARREDAEKFHQADLDVMDTLREKSFEETVTGADGQLRWLQTIKRPIVSADGTADQVLGVATDITARKRDEGVLLQAHAELELRVQKRTAELERSNEALQSQILERGRAEQALRDSESRYRLLFESNPVPLWVYDLETLRFLAVNEAAVELYGYSREEFLGMTLTEIRPSEDVPAHLEHLSTLDPLKKGRDSRRHRKKDGTIIHVETTSHFIDFAGRSARFVTINDITERKRAEEGRRQSEELLRNLINNTTAVIYVKKADGRYLLVNSQFEKLFHITLEEVREKTDHDIFPKGFADAFRANDLQVLQAKTAIQSEESAPHEDGLHTYISVKFPLFDTSGDPYAICGISTDVTERKSLEEQLRQSQKMDAVGRLAGGVAHDFNNLLTAILGYSEFLLENLKHGDPLRSEVEEIKKAGERAAALTRQLLAFSRKQILAPKTLSLNMVVSGMDRLLRRLIGEHIELLTLPASDLWPVKADPSQIEQVIVNLVVNSRDAMSAGGKLILETSNVVLDEAYARRHATVKPGRYVMLTVTDTGCGMDPETQSRVFEPFFSTKEPGKGTGLGLSTVYGIVRQSGGSIWVYSELGHGTTFKIFLPVAEEELEEEAEDANSASISPASETVLLVEDEEVVRKLAYSVLTRNGYRVLQARDGEEALRMACAHSGPIHVLLTDVVMPRMGGRELVEQLKPSRPEVKVIYMSGYTDDAIVYHGILGAGTPFLQKPYSPQALTRKVREVVEGLNHEKSSL
jgi:PAS domain S-box-containing protein